MKFDGKNDGGSWVDVEEPKTPSNESIKIPTQGSWADVEPQSHEQTFSKVLDANPDNIAEV